MKERIDGISYSLDHLTDLEIDTLKMYATQRVEEAMRDIDRLNRELARRNQETLPFSSANYAQVLGGAVARQEVTVTEATEALDGYGRASVTQ